ncbi:hypothetical protein HP532_20155, partial [Pseudomonas sp. CrR25]|nr:hypothetical protein [Pseudomonas sp. CrR25]
MNNNREKSTPTPPDDSPEGPARRTFLKLSAAAVAAPLLLGTRNGDAVEWRTGPQPVFPPSPATRPWLVELPRAITPVQPVAVLTPSAEEQPKFADEEAGREPHQRFTEL